MIKKSYLLTFFVLKIFLINPDVLHYLVICHIHFAPEYYTEKSLKLSEKELYDVVSNSGFDRSPSDFFKKLLLYTNYYRKYFKNCTCYQDKLSQIVSNNVSDIRTTKDNFGLNLIFSKNMDDESDKIDHKSFFNKSKRSPIKDIYSSTLSSFLLIFISEIGDKTFFITTILCLKFKKYIVFSASFFALFIMTIFSTLIGSIFSKIVLNMMSTNSFTSMPIDCTFSALFLFSFSAYHIYCALCDTHDDEIDNSTNYSQFTGSASSTGTKSQYSNNTDSYNYHSATSVSKKSSHEYNFSRSGSASTTNTVLNNGVHSDKSSKNSSKYDFNSKLSKKLLHSGTPSDENSHSLLSPIPATVPANGKNFYQVDISVLKKVFFSVLLSEIADKSMFSTIALSATQNPFGVFLGGILGHFAVTLLAILTGAIFGKIITEKVANLFGGLFFLVFAFLSIYEC